MNNNFFINENVTDATQKALSQRLEDADKLPRFFDANFFQLLSRVCDLLVDQDSENRIVNIAIFIDKRLTDKKGKGWRYEKLPPDEILYTTALKGINETAEINFGNEFLVLNSEQQKTILHSIQEGEAKGEVWKQIDAALFFETLLTEVAEIFYSYPAAQQEINYTGFADKHGWNM